MVQRRRHFSITSFKLAFTEEAADSRSEVYPRRRCGQLAADERQAIHGLHVAGHTQRQLAQLYRVTQSTIRRVVSLAPARAGAF
jgi:hypothetical protein